MDFLVANGAGVSKAGQATGQILLIKESELRYFYPGFQKNLKRLLSPGDRGLSSNGETLMETRRASPEKPHCACNLCRNKDTLRRVRLEAGSQSPLTEPPRLVPRL
jgi:hypothetical protein